MKITTLAMAALAACCLAQALHAQEPLTRFEPASFSEDRSELTRHMAFPDMIDDGLLRVFCDVRVRASGHLGSSYCWSEHDGAKPFIDAVLDPMAIARINPAHIDGRPREVWFQYTVQFEKRGGVESITLFPHQFVGIEGTGEGYTGPQRYHLPKITRGLLATCRGRFYIWYSMWIPATGGLPTDVTPLNISPNKNCNRHVLARVKGSLYIPAFLDGEPVTAPYREAWVDRFE